MKSIKSLLLILILALTGCKNYKEQVEQLQTTNQELSSSLENCNSSLEEYRNTFNDIEARLNRALPGATKAGQNENLQQLKARVNITIAQIDSLLKTNEQREQALRNRAYRAGSQVANLEEEIDTLNLMLVKKDSILNNYNKIIAELNSTIGELNSEIEELNQINTQMEERAEMITDSLNYAYFTSGTEDELIEKNIVEKTGGFLGFLGQVKTLNPQLDLSQLEKIDMRERKSFEVNAEADNLLMISPHPQGSYTIEANDEESATIAINDADEFWKVSRYLVLVTDD